MSLRECKICSEFMQRYCSCAEILTDIKPSIEYSADKWKQITTKILFIAEAPPFYLKTSNKATDSYFYNENEKQLFLDVPTPLSGTLSWNLFTLLGINSDLSKESKLKEFKKLSCYYIEALKCRICKFENKMIIKKMLKCCSLFLKRDVLVIQPKIIVVMGEKALYGLQCCQLFKVLETSSTINALLEQIKQPILSNNIKFYFIPLPVWRNKIYYESIVEIFNQIKAELKL